MSANIIEVAQMMQDREALQKDMSEAMALVRNLFQEKYMAKLQRAIDAHRNKALQNPPQEARLLLALKPFMPEQSQKAAERLIDAMVLTNTTKSIVAELMPWESQSPQVPAEGQPVAAALREESVENSIHEDGIYDVDYACLLDRETPAARTQPNMFALFFLLNMM